MCVCVADVCVLVSVCQCGQVCLSVHIYMETRGQSEVDLRSLSSEISHLAPCGRLITGVNLAMCSRLADYWMPCICQSLPCQSHWKYIATCFFFLSSTYSAGCETCVGWHCSEPAVLYVPSLHVLEILDPLPFLGDPCSPLSLLSCLEKGQCSV